MDPAGRGVAFIAAHQFLDLPTGGGLARRGLLDLLLANFDFVDVLTVHGSSVELTRVTQERRGQPRTIRRLKLARTRQVVSVLLAFARRKPLSTCLLQSLPRSVVTDPYELMVVDTVRMWKNRTAVDAKRIVLSLDDLLSCRYGSAAMLDEPELVFSANRPFRSAIARPIRFIVRRVLAREARLLSKYELDAANRSDVALVVSEREATILSNRGCTTPAHATGVPASPGAQAIEPQPGPPRVVLLGDFTYFDNIVALGQIYDALRHDAGPGPTIQVIGTVPSWLQSRYCHPRLVYLGFVAALDEAIGIGTVSLVAGANIGGLKTKAIESMMLGSAVWALAGQLDPWHFPASGAGVRTFETATELVAALSGSDLEPAAVREAGRAARSHAVSNFSSSGFAHFNRHLFSGEST